jgi:predicted phage-related endonuclease
MLGLSPYTKRAELLKKKATGCEPEVSASTQAVFDRGHETEIGGRKLAESIIGEDLFPVTMSHGRLSASCDGLTMAEDIAFEHKQWSESLAKSIADGILPEHHQPQAQQVLHVTGAEKLLFMTSDGTDSRCVWMWVYPQQDWIERIIAGWKQFEKDLAEYQPVEVIPAAVATPQMQLPAVSVQVKGGIEVRDNLAAFGDALTLYVERINHKPQSDQDFADLDGAVKTLKAAEEALTAAENNALGQAESLDLLRRTIHQFRELARTNRLQAEKTVKAEKENRRNAIIFAGKAALEAHIAELTKRLGKSYMPTIAADFNGVVKGLKTITSIQNAVDTELARVKIESSAIADKIEINLNTLRELAVDHAFLFADAGQLALKANDDLIATIKTRIAEHKAAEDKRLEDERAKIRQEEEAKAQASVQAVAPQQSPTLGEILQAVAPPAIVEAMAGNVQPIQATDTGTTIKLGEISERLGFTVTADFLAKLGYQATTDRNAKLYRAADFPAICIAIVRHVQAVGNAMRAAA